MLRKRGLEIVGGILILLAIGYFWRACSEDDKAPAPAAGSGSGRAAKVEVAAQAPAPAPDEHDAPRGVAPRWSLDVDPEGPLQLAGQVVDRDGTGVANAQVWIDTSPPRMVTADASGNFEVGKLVGRTYELTASTPALIGGPVTYKLTATSDPVVIRMGDGASVDVAVEDDAGKAVAKAEVTTGHEGGTTATTDDSGKATLKPVRLGFVVVEATADGYAPGTSFATLGSSGAHGQIRIVLRKGVAVSGHVVDEKGKPIAKAHVVVSNELGGGFGRRGRGGAGGPQDDEGVTNDKGEFAFAAVPAGSHTLAVRDGEHEPTTGAPFAVADKPVTGLEIKMKTGGVLAGVVEDKRGNAVPFASVRVAGSGRRMFAIAARQATTDKDGRFEVRGLVRGKLQVRAESESDASKLVEVDLESTGEKRDVRLVLDVSGMISGVVVDDKGQPAPEVAVNAFPDILGGASTENFALAGMSSTTTDGAGAFTVHGLPDGAYKLWASRGNSGNQEWGQHGASAKTGDKNVRITLPGVGSLIGKLKIDGQDSPPHLATVSVGYQMPTPIVDGAFEVKDVAAGTYDVHFRGADFAAFTKQNVVIAADKPTDLGTVLVFRGRKLVGTVIDAAGTPVAGAKVRVGTMLITASSDDPNANFDDVAGIHTAITDADGGFAVIGVPQKETNVVADHPDKGRSLAQAVPLTDGDPPPMTLQLRGYGSIAGTVTSKGQPLAGIAVSEASQGGTAQASFARTSADGSFVMPKVPEGAHVLNALQPNVMSVKSASAQVTVVAGKQSTVHIDIPVGDLSLAVTVKPISGQQVDAAQLFLFHGQVTATNAKQLTDGFFQSSVEGMKFWFGATQAAVTFDELVAGAYTLCGVPITGNMQDPTFLGRLQENMEILKVYCKAVPLAPSPTQQTVESDLPAMVSLPSSGSGK